MTRSIASDEVEQIASSRGGELVKTFSSTTIVVVTGAFVAHHRWKAWQEFFESKGFKTSAPSRPLNERTASELRMVLRPSALTVFGTHRCASISGRSRPST